jgi:hypothetical protein
MKSLIVVVTLLLALASPVLSVAVGLYPWELGMSKSEVSSFKEFGPYRTFSNGDIETFNGIYDGTKENIQFFFDAKGLLRRIGVYLYEGQDIQAARAVWRRAYDSLAKNYGKIEIPDVRIGANSEPVNSEILSIAAAANVDAVGKTQMAPVDQPKDMFVFSSFVRREVQAVRYIYVIVYFDRRP